MSGPAVELLQPANPEDWEAAREILREYAGTLNVDLCFQQFDRELAELPQEYAAPGGLLLLALVDGAVAGSGAFRPLPDSDYPDACEMKRLYVRPAFRRFGLGRLIAEALLDRATEAGYSTMLLDTLDDMEAARGLYEALGFVEIPPYYFNPIPGAHYLKAELGPESLSRFVSL
ncbi:GNAT family N-acetyltransferase [Roseateles sp.]|uniref:GNAT family N-acetyltransferase n=1 Tax=Roseateles sp. TaxID=1971397 RepID=UPI003922C288